MNSEAQKQKIQELEEKGYKVIHTSPDGLVTMETPDGNSIIVTDTGEVEEIGLE